MWLSDFEVVLRDRVIPRGAVRIEDGMIAEIREEPAASADVNGDGRLLLPGFVDMHGDMIEREIEPRLSVRFPLELGIFELDKKLAGNGITTAFAALSFHASNGHGQIRSEEHSRSIIQTLIQLRKNDLLVDHRVHARFEITFTHARAVIEDLLRAGALDLVSLMDHTPGQGQYRDIERHIETIARNNRITLEQAAQRVQQRMENRAQNNDAVDNLQCIAATAREHGVIIASHDDDSAEKVMVVEGLGACISEFPVTMAAAQEARKLGLATAMGAPNALRGLSYSGNLSAREAYEHGVLDILASDYHPASMLPAAIALAKAGAGGLSASVALVSANPASALGLTDRGAIEVGLRADLVVAEGGHLPRLRATFSRGKLVYSDGTVPGLSTPSAI
ncbi:alpha-D-ribose 1-methylphosphonate 5-triphosphate diphosphatase [Rhizobium sp. BK196]|uniref:alpha-D-ribose 1-methylphosphonate 5-triphosphate diphosphatase n=1 Tax=Rhizobium sp. BK196 TaxID=2587073 RepID=UPI00160F0044|nr:alpha-D-ribose 1-methylphosphonate 5-triphosphate diphosphatase [Rhizobium sp. BK196]MBB3310484.1 alpha-D-ribose 1-methylphosphonate 5-triphosphate diphosphatase [Rhizobium sp. BK196]